MEGYRSGHDSEDDVQKRKEGKEGRLLKYQSAGNLAGNLAIIPS